MAERLSTTTNTDGDAKTAHRRAGDAIHLALWNRGDEVEVTGDDGLLDRWRAAQAASRAHAPPRRSWRRHQRVSAGARVRSGAARLVAIPASTPSGSTTIAWAWPNPLS